MRAPKFLFKCGAALVFGAAVLWGAPLRAGAPVWESGYFDWRLTAPTERNSGNNPLPIIGPIKNQGQYSTCWTFGALASYESGWARQLQKAGLLAPDSRVDFAERYLAWTTYAPPREEPDDPTPRHSLGWDDKETSYERKIYNQGGCVRMAKNSLLLNGTVPEALSPYVSDYYTDMAGVSRRIAPAGLLHDVYSPVLMMQRPINQHGEIFQRVKQLIAENGAIMATYRHVYDPRHSNKETGEIYYDGPYDVGHAIALVGWDDDYKFTSLKHADGTPLKNGAWIVRNSWGTDNGKEGYYYISYEDTSLGETAFFNAELDSGRYSQADGHFGWEGCRSNIIGFKKNHISVASALKSSANQMVKALSFTASNPSMSYEITIRSGSLPGQGTVLGRQSGAFGSGGSSAWEGWRTVDLDSFVFLPMGAPYVVEVTTKNSDASEEARTQVILTHAGAFPTDAFGRSFFYDAEKELWLDFGEFTAKMPPQGLGVWYAVDMAVRGKDSNQPNGGDFAVSWLDDGGAGGSLIDLGRADELYKTDALHPDRRTLSNMTVNLDQDVTNNYGGSITGEGAVIKTGGGFLELSGTSDYSGGTRVEAGTLAVNGALASPVDVSSGARLQGSGVIQNVVTNDGSVAPGNSIGTLTVGSYVQEAGGLLELEGSAAEHDRLVVTGAATLDGKVNFTPAGYFANGETILDVRDFVTSETGTVTIKDSLQLTGTSVSTNTVTISAQTQSGESFNFTAARAADAYSSLGDTVGGIAAGRALDQAAGKATGDGAALVGAIDFMSAQDVAAALDQLHPEAYDSLLYSAMDNNHRLSDLVSDRLTGRRVPEGQGMNWYFQPFGTIARQNGWAGYGGFKSQNAGILIGGEKRRGGWTLGVHGGFIHDGTKVQAASPLSSSSDGGFIGLQAKRAADPEKGLFLYGLARVGWDRYETRRPVAFGDYYRENSAKWTGFSGALEIGAGWNHKSGKTMLTPVAALNYAMVTRPGISEIGSGGALNLDSADYQSLRSSLGVKVSFMEGRLDRGVRYAIDASALWHHEFLDRGARYDGTLLGGPIFTKWREGAGRDSVALTLGAEFSDSDRFSVRAAAGTELFRPGASSFTGSLRLEWKF